MRGDVPGSQVTLIVTVHIWGTLAASTAVLWYWWLETLFTFMGSCAQCHVWGHESHSASGGECCVSTMLCGGGGHRGARLIAMSHKETLSLDTVRHIPWLGSCLVEDPSRQVSLYGPAGNTHRTPRSLAPEAWQECTNYSWARLKKMRDGDATIPNDH